MTSGLCLNQIDTVNVTICSLLPTELEKVNLNCTSNKNILTWTTNSELNNDYFIIERANENLNFERIGVIKGPINSSSKTDYSFLDHSPHHDMTYYRLSQVHLDGITRELKTLKIKPDCLYVFLDTAPYFNSESDTIILKSSKSVDINYYLIDITGRVILSNERSLESGRNHLNINEVANSVYFIVLDSEFGTYKYKINITP